VDLQESPLNIDGWWRRGEGAVPADQVCRLSTRRERLDIHTLHRRHFFSGSSHRSTQRSRREQQKLTSERRSATIPVQNRTERARSLAASRTATQRRRRSGRYGLQESAAIQTDESMQVMEASMPRAGADGDDKSDDDDDDDDGVEDSISGSDPNNDASSDAEGDGEDQSDAERDSNAGDCDDTDIGSSVTDADDSVNRDAKASAGPTNSDEAESNAVQTCFSDSKKRKRNDYRKEDARTRRKRLRSLPAFVSYEDYAHLIENEAEEYL
jgi:hypothetical protein